MGGFGAENHCEPQFRRKLIAPKSSRVATSGGTIQEEEEENHPSNTEVEPLTDNTSKVEKDEDPVVSRRRKPNVVLSLDNFSPDCLPTPPPDPSGRGATVASIRLSSLPAIPDDFSKMFSAADTILEDTEGEGENAGTDR